MSNNKIFNPNIKCNCSVLNSTYTPCPDKSNIDCCLRLCNILTNKDIKPCNEIGTLDVTQYIIIPTCCNSDIENNLQELSIPFHTDNLTNVTFELVNDQYIISYTSNWSQGLDYKSAKIVYQFKCGVLNVQAEIVIPFDVIENTCTTTSGIFNPCTGDYIETIGGVYGDHPDFDTTDHDEEQNHTTITIFTPGDNNVCNDPIIYNIEKYTPAELTNVTINSLGGISYDENCNLLTYPANIYIKYGATKCGITVFGEVRRYLNPCKGLTPDKCDPCDGIIVSANSAAIEVTCGSTGNEVLIETTGGTEFFIVDKSIFTNFTIVNNKITFDVPSTDLNYKIPYYITYRVKRNKIFCDAVVTVSLCDLCIGIPPKKNHSCDSCTGLYVLDCPEIEVEKVSKDAEVCEKDPIPEITIIPSTEKECKPLATKKGGKVYFK